MQSFKMYYRLNYVFKIKVPMSRSFTKLATKTAPVSSVDYCANIVRQHDYENYLATLLITKAIRTPALVIRAFNVEIARVQDQTTDSQTAAFRLQFWHDILSSVYNKNKDFSQIPANPVAQELFKVCHSFNLPRRHFEKLITSRSGIAKLKYFRTLEDVETYAEQTVSSIYYLLLGIAGVTNVHADHVASHLGKAQGITNILRSIHISTYYKMVPLPMDILMKNKISQEDVLRGTQNEHMQNVIFEVASRANSHLKKARSIAVPKLTNQLFLPATAIDIYLTKLQKNTFHVFDKSLQTSSPTLPFHLYYKRLLNKY